MQAMAAHVVVSNVFAWAWPGLAMAACAGIALGWRHAPQLSTAWRNTTVLLAAGIIATLLALAILQGDFTTNTQAAKMIAPFVALTMLVEGLLVVLIERQRTATTLFVSSAFSWTFTVAAWLLFSPQHPVLLWTLTQPSVLAVTAALMGTIIATAIWSTMRRVRACL
jgi:hypothetical protein